MDGYSEEVGHKVPEKKKIRLLAYGDYCCSTGFGTVMSNIMQELAKSERYEIDVVGINYGGDPYDTKKWPGRVWPAISGTLAGVPQYADVYGRQRVLDLLGTGEYDVIFMLQDAFILEHKKFLAHINNTKAMLKKENRKVFKTVFYFPVDATPMDSWAIDVVGNVDVPVVYTEYGKQLMTQLNPLLEDKLQVMYHGTNPNHFNYIEDRDAVAKFREEYFGDSAKGRFLLTNVNRNQPRKDIPRSLMIARELKDKGYNPLMYLHMQVQDSGGNIDELAHQLGLVAGQDYVTPSPNIFSANQGLPIEVVNMIYNASDAVFSTTLGEGWGLSITESMATKTPVIAPDHTSLTEMLAENRGKLVPAGNTPSLWVALDNDLDRIRPQMDVEAAADAIADVMDGKNLPDVEAAYTWAHELTWSNLCKKWVQIIDNAAAQVSSPVTSPFLTRQQRRALERKKTKGQK